LFVAQGAILEFGTSRGTRGFCHTKVTVLFLPCRTGWISDAHLGTRGANAGALQNVKWLAFAGDLGYQFLLSLNPFINFVRRRFGAGYWSLSAYTKRRVKEAVSFIAKFEAAVAHYAMRYPCGRRPLWPHP
jgi:UDP-2,3-diacylglucosamine pyrophosphatase LpxH